MKSTKYFIYSLLFAFVLGSCTEEAGYEKGEVRPYVRIPNRDIIMETDEENTITITPLYDSDETATGKYKWSVTNQELVKLVENGDNSVSITGLKPGKTYLKVESENGKLQYTSTLKINQSFQFEHPIFIDFGTIESSKPFNNMLSSVNSKLQGLVDAKGFTSKYAIEVNGSFLTLDRSSHINTLGFPDNVAFDMFFNDGISIASAGFILSKLKANTKYTFVFYATIADDNVTQTEYAVKGQNEGKALLYTSNNQSNVATIKDIIPDSDGKIKITLQPGPNNTQWAKFYGITSMIIIPENYELDFPLSF
ncbi:hypothetical protein JGH11_06995 [Dysgonomonas sp. Marseille-P4677]|uniref:hypothetical protein n=1 Tax=Dysgonomonas sp. Marseille-P4677 TaxID=2364790 RepID=UPI0019112F12|nr:hypothetical protein [Dysgonomonas sp. Marseille-P4677]MBK5720614.1 hypothetical protein [Dysgonomonas sp. Marseille-P4677]